MRPIKWLTRDDLDLYALAKALTLRYTAVSAQVGLNNFEIPGTLAKALTLRYAAVSTQ